MAELTTYKCDCGSPQCGRVKVNDQTINWWLVMIYVSAGKQVDTYMVMPWDDTAAAEKAVLHMSSRNCVNYHQSKWMDAQEEQASKLPHEYDPLICICEYDARNNERVAVDGCPVHAEVA